MSVPIPSNLDPPGHRSAGRCWEPSSTGVAVADAPQPQPQPSRHRLRCQVREGHGEGHLDGGQTDLFLVHPGSGGSATCRSRDTVPEGRVGQVGRRPCPGPTRARLPSTSRSPPRCHRPPYGRPVVGRRQDGAMSPAEPPVAPSSSEPAVADPSGARSHQAPAEQVEDARWRYHVLDEPTISDGEFDRRMRELESSRRVPGAADAGLADPAGRRGGVDRVHGRSTTSSAWMSPGQRVLLRGARRVARPAGARGRRATPLPVRAEDRRPGDQPALRERPAGPGPHPRRRPHRRGRHPQRAGRSRAIPHRLTATTSPVPELVEVRGEVFFPVEAFERAQRVAGRGRQGRRSPTRATRRPGRCGRRTRGSPRPGRWAWSCHGIGARRGLRAGPAVAGVRRAARWGLPTSDHVKVLRPRRRSRGTSRTAGEHRHRRRARDRRRRRQGRRGRGAAPARRDVAGAAVGDRLQVPARGGQRQAPRHPGQRRPHRAG